jgi:hypothetical protein
MSNTSSALYAATMKAASANKIPLVLQKASADTINMVPIGTEPNQLLAWKLPDSASSLLYANVPVPLYWNTARVKIRWTILVFGSGGNARLLARVGPYTAADGATNGEEIQTSSAVPPTTLDLKENTFTSTAILTPGEGFQITFGRLGSASTDTYANDIYIVDAWLERLS